MTSMPRLKFLKSRYLQLKEFKEQFLFYLNMNLDIDIDLLPNVKMTKSFIGRYKTHHGTTYEINLNTGLKITKVSNIHCPIDPYITPEQITFPNTPGWIKEQWPVISEFVLLHRFVLQENSKTTSSLK